MLIQEGEASVDNSNESVEGGRKNHILGQEKINLMGGGKSLIHSSEESEPNYIRRGGKKTLARAHLKKVSAGEGVLGVCEWGHNTERLVLPNEKKGDHFAEREGKRLLSTLPGHRENEKNSRCF